MGNYQDITFDFLLGKLGENERASFEESFVTDRAAFEKLLDAENELIDGYVADRLSDDDRRRVEAGLRTNVSQRQKVVVARALAAYSANLHAPEMAFPGAIRRFIASLSQPPAFAFAAAALLVVAGAFFWFSSSDDSQMTARVESEITQAPPNAVSDTNTVPEPAIPQASAPEANGEKPAQPVEKSPSKPGPAQAPVVATLVLSSGITRSGGDIPSIKARRSGTVRLQMDAVEEADEYASLVVIVETVAGDPVWSGRVGSTAKPVTAAVPARRLGPGDYIVTLKGVRPNGTSETIEEYTFNVR